MMEQVRPCAVWNMENWLGSSLNQILGWMSVRICYCYALEKGCLEGREVEMDGTDLGRTQKHQNQLLFQFYGQQESPEHRFYGQIPLPSVQGQLEL